MAQLDQIYADDVESNRNTAHLLVTGLKKLKKDAYINMDAHEHYERDDPTYATSIIGKIMERAVGLTKDTSINFDSKDYSEYMTDKLKEKAEQNKISLEKNKSRVDGRYRPEKLNGTQRNKPMTFKQADSGSINPKYGKTGYSTNCQSAIAVFEARLRGYDLETLPNNKQTRCKELSERSSEVWIDPTTGENLTNRKSSVHMNTKAKLYKYLNDTIEVGERNSFSFPWKGYEYEGHVITAYKNSKGQLVFYDPLSKRVHYWR